MADTKVHVPVIAAFDKDGLLLPLELTWEDDCTYMIDQILDVRPAVAIKASGQGDRQQFSLCINFAVSYC